MHTAGFLSPPPKLRQKTGKYPYEVKQQNHSKVLASLKKSRTETIFKVSLVQHGRNKPPVASRGTLEQGSKLLLYSLELVGKFRRVALASSRLIPPKPQSTTQTLYPLRGIPIRYENPTEPVAEDDWSALE